MIHILAQLEEAEILDVDKLINEFMDYYKAHDRHKYHEITVYILGKFQTTNEGETVSFILSNLEIIMKEVKKRCKCNCHKQMDECMRANPPLFRCFSANEDEKCYEYKWLYRKLNKLHDHISLEETRTSDISGRNHEFKTMLEAVLNKEKELEEKLVEENQLRDKIKEELEKDRKAIDDDRKEIKSMQKEYITILGIFAAIVLAFTGGIAFSTSVLENIDATSPYRLTSVVIGLAFILINIIYILVWFIQKLNAKKDEILKMPAFIKIINSVLVIALLIVGILYYCFEMKEVDIINENKTSVTIEKSIEITKSQGND